MKTYVWVGGIDKSEGKKIVDKVAYESVNKISVHMKVV